MPEPSLRSQDVLVLAKLLAYAGPRPSMAQVAVDLSISPSEVHAALKRLTRARLLSNEGPSSRPVVEHVEEFLLHGIRYIFPATRGEVTVGLLTSYAVLAGSQEHGKTSDLPPVWPFPDGRDRGVALEPLYPTAPAAAMRDPALYELLALIDALRDPDRRIAAHDMRAILGDRRL